MNPTRILVVDDEVELCRRVARLLARDGYAAETAFTVDEAFAMIEESPPDLLISDISMPGANGFDLLERIQASDLQEFGIIMMTGVDDTGTAEKTQELGAHGYLSKPFDRNTLLISVTGVLRRVRLEAENAAYRSQLEGRLLEQRSELENSRRIATALINRSSDVLVVVSTEREVTYVSPSLQDALGIAPDEFIGRKVPDLVHPSDLPAVNAAREQAVLGTDSQTLELRLQNSDGAWTWFEAIGEAHLNDPAIRGFVISLRDITERHRRQEMLESQALHDQLTSLPNRWALLERLRSVVGSVRDSSNHAAVLFLDVDRLKVINDSLGHETGDEILRVVAARLRNCIRHHDMVARFGGDEFVVVCERLASPEDSYQIAETISRHLAEPITVGERQFHVSASIGVVEATADYADGEDLVRDADAAMYKAKQSGRAQIRTFDAETHDQALRRLDFESAMRNGRVKDEWVLHFQPQVDAVSTRVVGVEALVRWNHPQRGILYPSEFLDIAEDVGLMADLGRFVLESACAAAKEFEKVQPNLRISINIASGQLLSVGFADTVRTALQRFDLNPSQLCVEITESAMIKDLGSARGALEELRSMGTEIAIDDFGTGFSALSYLADFPATELKIDRSFIVGSGTPTGRKLLAGIVRLAASLGLRTVAEGVEDEGQRAQLLECGCDIIQGYLFSKPLEHHDLLDYFAGRAAIRPA